MDRKLAAAIAVCIALIAGCERPAEPLAPLAVWNKDLESPTYLKELLGREVVMRTPMMVRFIDSTSANVDGKELVYDIHSLHTLDDVYVIKAGSPRVKPPTDVSKRIVDGTYFVRGVVVQEAEQFRLAELQVSEDPFAEINAVEFQTQRPDGSSSIGPSRSPQTKRFEGPELRSRSVLAMIIGQRIEFPAVVKRRGTQAGEVAYELLGHDSLPIITGVAAAPIPEGEWWVRGTVEQDAHGFRLVNLERVEIIVREPLRATWSDR